jgi:hypothetical protein
LGGEGGLWEHLPERPAKEQGEVRPRHFSRCSMRYSMESLYFALGRPG